MPVLLKNSDKERTIFEIMLEKAEKLFQAGNFEYSITQCHITLDHFINVFLEVQFIPELDILKQNNPNLHRLFLRAIWENSDNNRFLSFLEKFGDYTTALGFEFKGHHLYSDLKDLNSIRNGIVHNRIFATEISSERALKFIKLTRKILNLYRKEFNSFLNFKELGMRSSYKFVDEKFNVSISKDLSKQIYLYYEFDLAINCIESNKIIFPRKTEHPHPIFNHFIVQVCGIDYIRYGTEKPHKNANKFDIEPSWCNGHLLSLKANLNFFEIARNIESHLLNQIPTIRNLIADLVAKKYAEMFKSWEKCTFTHRVILSRWFEYLFNLSNIAEQDNVLINLLTCEWKLIVVNNLPQGLFMNLSTIKKLVDKRVILCQCVHPSEIDFVIRASDNNTFLKKNLLVFIPDSYPQGSLCNFVKAYLTDFGKNKNIEVVNLRDAKDELRIKHKDTKFFGIGSDYDTIATNCNTLKYIAEMIYFTPHINGEHWFIREMLLIAESLPSKKERAEIYYFLEDINSTLGGRPTGFADLNNFKVKLQELLKKLKLEKHKEKFFKINERDFPFGFFEWSEVFYGTEFLFKKNRKT